MRLALDMLDMAVEMYIINIVAVRCNSGAPAVPIRTDVFIRRFLRFRCSLESMGLILKFFTSAKIQ